MDQEIMKDINLMVFDLDGTLVNSGGDIITSVNHTNTSSYTLSKARFPCA